MPADSLDAGFAQQAEGPPAGLFAEFWYLLRQNKKWWLAPIIIVLLLIGGLLMLGGTALAPYLYPFF